MFLAPFVVGKIALLCQKLKKLRTHLFSKQFLWRLPIKSCSFSTQYESLHVEFGLSSKFLPLPAFLEAKCKVCLRFSMIRKPKNKSWCLSEIGLFGEHSRDRVSFRFFQNVQGTQNSAWDARCSCSLFFLPRRISVWFQQNTQRLNFRLEIFHEKLFVGGRSPIYFSGMPWKPCELKSTNFTVCCRKYFQWSQLNSRSSLVDDCQIVWTLMNAAFAGLLRSSSFYSFGHSNF